MYNYINTKTPFYQTKKFWQITKWIIIAIIMILLILWANSYIKSYRQKELQKYYAEFQKVSDEFRASVNNSNSSSDKLTILGKKMMESSQDYWAVIVLEESSEKDKNYRDAAYMAGYANLKLENEIENQNEIIAIDLNAKNINEKALELLNRAKDLDPLYAPTYELLTIAYKNSGDAKNADLCYNKFKDFSKK